MRPKERPLSASLPGSGDRVIPTFCHGCGSYKPVCGLLCHVKDGKFVRVEGNPDAFNNGVPGSTSLCAKGLTGPQFVYAADRLKYPLKRIGPKGEGKFQRITWDEALDTIADKLKETKAKYGPEAYGVLSPEYWPVLGTLGRRFLNVYGSPNYMHSAICATPRMAAAKVTVGYISMEPDDWNKTKLYVNWGANVENSGVNKGTPRAILDALANGMQYIDIRPMLDPLGAKADMWLPVRPGTDCALALAMLNVLIGESLYDADFVAEWCHGFDKLAELRAPVPTRMGGAHHRPADTTDPRGRPPHRDYPPGVHQDGQRHRRPDQRRHFDHLGYLSHSRDNGQPRRTRRPFRPIRRLWAARPHPGRASSSRHGGETGRS